MTGWQATLVPRHICQVVFARRQKTPLRDVGAHQFRHVVFVSMPVGRKQLYSWICLQRGFLFCGCSDLCWLLNILFSPFDEVTLCVQVGRMLRRLPHSVQQNDGRCVRKYCNTLNDFIVWCLFCWRASWTEHAGVVSIRRCAMFGFC